MSATPAPQQGIAVQGSGVVTGVPDRLRVRIGVQHLAGSVEEGMAVVGATSQALLNLFTEHGVPTDDVQTGELSVYPQWDYSGNHQRIAGYQVATTYAVTLTEFEQAGPIVTAAGRVAGDDLVVHSVVWEMADDAELGAAAREAAFADARQRAAQLAELSGVTLGEPIWISEDSSPVSPSTPYQSRIAQESVSDIGVASGTTQVRVTLHVVFAIG